MAERYYQVKHLLPQDSPPICGITLVKVLNNREIKLVEGDPGNLSVLKVTKGGQLTLSEHAACEYNIEEFNQDKFNFLVGIYKKEVQNQPRNRIYSERRK